MILTTEATTSKKTLVQVAEFYGRKIYIKFYSNCTIQSSTNEKQTSNLSLDRNDYDMNKLKEKQGIMHHTNLQILR